MKKFLSRVLSVLSLTIVIMIGINALYAVAATCNHSFTDSNDTECNICQQKFAIIKFNSNGGSSIEQIRTPVNESVIIPFETPIRSNYIFAGWSTNKNGDVMYKAGASFKAVNSITLYAQWNKKCSVTESATCSACSGSGEKLGTVTCYNCSGSGVYTVYTGCTNGCNIDGYIMQQCTYCKGTKEVRLCNTCSSGGNKAIAQLNCVANHDTYYGLCYKCDSNGNMRVDCPKCVGGSVASTKKCNWCSGSGKEPGYITCSGCSGKGTVQKTCTKCNGSGVVSRKSVSAPGKPVLKKITLNTIELKSISNGEYSLDGKVWQDSPVFNITEEKEYTFYQRYAKTDTTYASPASAALKVLYHNHVYDNSCDTTCNTCNEIRSVTHIYDGSCDTQCNLCLETRITSVAHSYDNACDADCNICYYKRSSSVVHTYDNACDTTCDCGYVRTITHTYDNSCDTDCNICGNTRVIQHKYSLDFDITKHFNKCTECGDITDSKTHKFDNACDTTCDCGYVRTITHTYDNSCDTDCNICGNTRVIQHKYSLVFDITKHFNKCIECGDITDSETHKFDNACDNNCRCGYVRTVTHNYQMNQGTSATHWKECSICSDRININLHVYDNACDSTCSDCGYVRVTYHNYQSSYDSKHHFDKCINCGDVINIRAHEFDNACDAMCNYCRAMRTITHDYGSGKITKAATCKTEGVKTYTCYVCKGTKTETIAKLTTHTYSNNCDKSCDICDVIRTDVEHKYTNACDATCDYCGEKRTTGDHIYDDKDDNYCNACNYYSLLKYKINSDRTITIIDLDNSYSGKFEIPEKINGYLVTKIEAYAFDSCTKLTSITIPDSIVCIGDNAFDSCDALTKVHISDISAWCNIKFSDVASNPVYCGAFGGYRRKLYLNGSLVTAVKIPEGVTAIGDYAFCGYSELKSVKIPNSVKTIGEEAFYRCTKLESIVIPNSVTSIGGNTFYGCKNLIKVTLPDNLTRIEGGLFAECSNLISFNFPSKLKSIGSWAFAECDSLVTVKIPKGVTEIGQNAFEHCQNLRTVVLPEGITEISLYTFRSCFNLESITIPKSLKKIGQEAFLNTHAQKVYISDLAAWCNIEFERDDSSESPLSNYADIYLNNKRLVDVVIPKKVTSIRNHAFYGCQNIKSVTLHDNITSIGDSAFEYCSKLESINLPDSIKSIGDRAFSYCYNLKKIAIPKNTTVVGGGAFSESGVKVLYIPKGTAFIKADAFDYVKYDQNGFPNDMHVTYVYYGGSKSDKKNLTILPGNDALGTAKWIYNVKGLPKCVYDNSCDTTCNVCGTTRTVTHSYKTTTTKATFTKNGKIVNKCSDCGYSKTTTVYYPKTIKLSKTSYTYNGKTQTPSVTVKDSKGNALKKDTDYTVKYASGRKSTGKYSVTITFKGKYSGTKTLYFNILPSKTSKITPTCSTTEIKASWKSVTGASGYRVELLNSKGKVVKKVTTIKTSYTFKKLSKVTTYKIRVTAYKTIDKKAAYSSVSTTITTSTAPAKVTLSKVTAGSKSATPAWKTVSGASGYQVQYSTSSKFKSAKTTTVSKGSSKKTTIKKLTKGKKYYFKVRAYKTVDGKKVYGAWSSVKSVKVK